MNTLKLENTLLKFILNQNLEHIIINGVTTKVISMMYCKGIDYYYSDLLATAVGVDVRFVDSIYLYNQSKYYKASLVKLLENVTDSEVEPKAAETFEKEVNNILETRKRIHTKQHNNYNKGVAYADKKRFNRSKNKTTKI